MTEQEVLEMLENVGAFRKGHFVFTSGRHSDTYVNKDALYPYTRETSRICRAFAEHFAARSIEAVVGPAIGAAILSQWTAYHLTGFSGYDVYSVYADKDGEGGFVIRRGYDSVIKGKRTIVVEDLMTTGGSAKKVVEAARAAGADIAGVAVVCNRGGVVASDIGNPPEFISLVNLHLESWEEKDCDLCAKGIPVNTEVGHGKNFLERKRG